MEEELRWGEAGVEAVLDEPLGSRDLRLPLEVGQGPVLDNR